jgi:hypothetical protein
LRRLSLSSIPFKAVGESFPEDATSVVSSSWGVASPVRGNGVEVPEDDVRECSRLVRNELGQVLRLSVAIYNTLTLVSESRLDCCS